HPEHHQPDDMEEGDSDDDIVRDMEEEKMEREGDAAPVPIRRPSWVNPYEGQPEPKDFSRGGGQIRRYCLNMERRTLLDVLLSATEGSYMTVVLTNEYGLVGTSPKGHRNVGLSEMGYTFLDPGHGS
ncbi:hypothetical protein A2U01_0039385, partial [Trifolium medium]|nr:hypothetical protein [Trifolium medium]